MCSIAAEKTILRREDGAALVVTMLMLLALASMALIVTSISGTDLVVSGNDRMHQASLDVAEAGLAEAMARLGSRPGTMVNVGGTSYDVSIRDTSRPPNPNWTARIFLTSPGNAPAAGPNEFHTGTIQTGNILRYSHASDLSRVLEIRHKLFDFNGDGVAEVVLYDPSRIPSENPFSGEPVERIIVRGEQGNASRTVLADVIRFPISINVLAALLADADVDLRGNVAVCGRDHRGETPNYTQLPGCSPAWDQTQGHLEAVMTTGDQVLTRGSTDALGNPTAINNDPTNSFLSMAETLGISISDLQEILDNADHRALDTDPLKGVTYIDGDASANGISGEGLLYVTGNLTLSGNFAWKGLVYVEGDLVNTGNTWILGGVVVRGAGSIAVDFGAGTPAILYSSDALIDAILGSMNYLVLNWKEV